MALLTLPLSSLKIYLWPAEARFDRIFSGLCPLSPTAGLPPCEWPAPENFVLQFFRNVLPLFFDDFPVPWILEVDF